MIPENLNLNLTYRSLPLSLSVASANVISIPQNDLPEIPTPGTENYRDLPSAIFSQTLWVYKPVNTDFVHPRLLVKAIGCGLETWERRIGMISAKM